jgi:hypothetical protein
MDLKKSLTIAIGVIVVAIVVVAIAAVAFNLINGDLSGEPTPGPSATPGPSDSSVTPSPGAAAGATPTTNPGTTVAGRIYVGAVLNRTSGMCLVTIMLNKDATPIDVSKLSMNIECDGQTYRNVWTPKAYDWAGSNGNTMLEFGEALSPQIDTAGLGIPQNRPITIKILQDGAELQHTTVSPE